MCANDGRAGKCSCHWNWRAGHASLVVGVVSQTGITCTLRSNYSRHRRTELDSCRIRVIPVPSALVRRWMSLQYWGSQEPETLLQLRGGVFKLFSSGSNSGFVQTFEEISTDWSELDGCCIIREDTVPSLWY
jgi:hypothetical protein